MPADRAAAATSPSVAADRHFDTAHLKSDLRGRAMRGGAFTLGGQGVQFLLQLGFTVILARLLTPADFGLVGMATVVTGFTMLFRDLGLSIATVQRDQITHQQVSNLFWINVAISAVIAGLVMAMSPAVAWFYGDPRLTWITIVLATSIVLGGCKSQHNALLLRQMRFAALAKVDVLSKFVSVAVAIVAALLGAGYWALVLFNVAGAVVTLICWWWLTGWRPGLPRYDREVWGFLKFGGNLTAFQLVNYLSRHVDNLLIGWYWGAGPLGLYSRAYQLLLFPMQQLVRPISRVTTPTLSRVQDDPERYRQCYRKAVLPLVALTAPMVAFSAVQAHNMVRVVLGPQWLEAAEIFLWLSPAAYVAASYAATGWVYVSLGRTDRQLRWGMLSAALTLIGFAICLPYGPVAVAAGFSIVTVATRYHSIVYCFKGTPLTMQDAVDATWVPTMASLVAAGVCLVSAHLLPPLPSIVALAINGCVYCAAYAGAWMLPQRGREQAKELINLSSAFKRRPTVSAPLTTPAPVAAVAT